MSLPTKLSELLVTEAPIRLDRQAINKIEKGLLGLHKYVYFNLIKQVEDNNSYDDPNRIGTRFENYMIKTAIPQSGIRDIVNDAMPLVELRLWILDAEKAGRGVRSSGDFWDARNWSLGGGLGDAMNSDGTINYMDLVIYVSAYAMYRVVEDMEDNPEYNETKAMAEFKHLWTTSVKYSMMPTVEHEMTHAHQKLRANMKSNRRLTPKYMSHPKKSLGNASPEFMEVYLSDPVEIMAHARGAVAEIKQNRSLRNSAGKWFEKKNPTDGDVLYYVLERLRRAGSDGMAGWNRLALGQDIPSLGMYLSNEYLSPNSPAIKRFLKTLYQMITTEFKKTKEYKDFKAGKYADKSDAVQGYETSKQLNRGKS